LIPSYVQSQLKNIKNLYGHYLQESDWQNFNSNLQWTEILVPTDYVNLKSNTLHLSVLRYAAPPDHWVEGPKKLYENSVLISVIVQGHLGQGGACIDGQKIPFSGSFSAEQDKL
jgi:hypothetical protein